MRHTHAENATYWANQADGWFDEHVHGKPVGDVEAIAGQAIVELPDGWTEDDAHTARVGLIGAGFPPTRVEDRRDGGKRLRIDANDDRLPIQFGGD